MATMCEEMVFNGKTAIITGAASGMGQVAAQSLSRLGASVVMCDVNEATLKNACEEINVKGGGKAFSCVSDVRCFADAEKAANLALEKTGRIDILLNFAGGWEPRMLDSMRPFHVQPVEVLDWGLDVNLRGAIYFARACMPSMVRAKGGVICCIGSVNGFFGDAMGPMYGVAKSGLFNFVKSLALAGAEYGVRAFCVSPGPVMTRPGMAAMKTPLNRGATPDEIVEFILYLCSDKGSFVTGSNHVIDGGFLAMRPK